MDLITCCIKRMREGKSHGGLPGSDRQQSGWWFWFLNRKQKKNRRKRRGMEWGGEEERDRVMKEEEEEDRVWGKTMSSVLGIMNLLCLT